MAAPTWRRLILAAPLLIPALRAQDSETIWQDITIQANYAFEAHNLALAEQTYLKAVHEAERFGPGDARLGTTLAGLGTVYRAEKKLGEAEEALQRAANILESAHGEDSADVGDADYKLAGVLIDQGKYAAALTLLGKSLRIYQGNGGANDLQTASMLCMIGDANRALKSWTEAETPLRRCAEIREANGGLVNAELGDAVNSLAQVYVHEGKYTMADSEFKLAERIREKTLGITSPLFADTLEAHASMLRQLGRDREAAKDAALAAAIRRREKKTN